MIGSYLLILILNYDATYIEFPTQASCYKAREELVAEIKKIDKDVKPAIQCFKKIGGSNKNT